MSKSDKKGKKVSKPLIERIRGAKTYGELKEHLSESESLRCIEKRPNGDTRYHGPTGMVSVHDTPDNRPVKFGTKKQIILLAVKAGLLILVLTVLVSVVI